MSSVDRVFRPAGGCETGLVSDAAAAERLVTFTKGHQLESNRPLSPAYGDVAARLQRVDSAEIFSGFVTNSLTSPTISEPSVSNASEAVLRRMRSEWINLCGNLCYYEEIWGFHQHFF